MESEQSQTKHYEDPNRLGWCAACGCAYPCPGTATPDETRKLLARYGR